MSANDPMGKQSEPRRLRERQHLTQAKRSQPNNPASFSERPFTVASFAEFMDVVPKTVRKWIETKKLEAFCDGRIIRITSAAARKFIRKHIK